MRDPASATRPGGCASLRGVAEDLTREELEELVQRLRDEVARLKEEIRSARRDAHEVPPHYL